MIKGEAPKDDLDSFKSFLIESVNWLADVAHENLATEIILSHLQPGSNWTLQFLRVGREIQGISIVTPSGHWFLEAKSEDQALTLASLTCRLGLPKRMTCSGVYSELLRSFVLDIGEITREHYMDVLICNKAVVTDGPEWANQDHLDQLAEYQVAYNQERNTSNVIDVDNINKNRMAVLIKNSKVASVVKYLGATTNYACIGGTYTFPQERRKGYASQVIQFIVSELLKIKPAVHLIVDSDNVAAMGVYKEVGFKSKGTCYMAYLR